MYVKNPWPTGARRGKKNGQEGRYRRDHGGAVGLLCGPVRRHTKLTSPPIRTCFALVWLVWCCVVLCLTAKHLLLARRGVVAASVSFKMIFQGNHHRRPSVYATLDTAPHGTRGISRFQSLLLRNLNDCQLYRSAFEPWRRERESFPKTCHFDVVLQQCHALRRSGVV